jgi:Ca-activated chloride channel family protein
MLRYFIYLFLLSIFAISGCSKGSKPEEVDGRLAGKAVSADAPVEKVEKATPIAPPMKSEAVPAPKAKIVEESAPSKPTSKSKKATKHSPVSAAVAVSPMSPPLPPPDREQYTKFDDNPIKAVAQEPVSTLSVDVDKGSYANVRRMLKQGKLPPKDAVRVEEMINYFNYNYPIPKEKNPPFSVMTEVAPTPWNPNTVLLHVGLQGHKIQHDALPPMNLVFLIDVSGSMDSPERLPLLKSAFSLLTNQLRAQDKVAIVVYAGAAGLVLESTAGDNKAKILNAINNLHAGGSTNGGQGIQLAFSVAEQALIPNGVNRVLLATDGDFNVGTTSFEALKDFVASKRSTGVALTTLGFGMGNYNDRLVKQLADAGNGNYAYIDTLNEAQKVFNEEMSATLFTIAKDVKVQIEFNPDLVSEYRLIGYEQRLLKREDFSNDKVDAGEIGAGHSVTALYELALKGSGGERLEKLRYQSSEKPVKSNANELAFLRLRYKLPKDEQSQLLEFPIKRQEIESANKTTDAFRFSAAVAGFGQLLRGSNYLMNFGYEQVRELAQNSTTSDPYGYRGEFLQLIGLAQALSPAK